METIHDILIRCMEQAAEAMKGRGDSKDEIFSSGKKNFPGCAIKMVCLD